MLEQHYHHFILANMLSIEGLETLNGTLQEVILVFRYFQSKLNVAEGAQQTMELTLIPHFAFTQYSQYL